MQENIQDRQYNAQLQKDLRQLEIKSVGKGTSDETQLRMLLRYILLYPNLEKAQIHHRSNNMGTNDLLQKQKQVQRQIREQKVRDIEACQCCGILAHNKQLPFCTNLQKINLGLGIYLFFKNYAFHAIVFTLMFLIYSLFAIITNSNTYYINQNLTSLCVYSNSCGLYMIGAGNKLLNLNLNHTDSTNHLSQIQSWLGIAFVILWGLMYIVKTHREEKFIIDMEQRRISASDFTLMLTHVPRDYFYDKTKERKVDQRPVSKKIEGYGKYQQKPASKYQYLPVEDLTKKFNKDFMDYGRRINSVVSYEVVKVNVAKPLYQKSQQEQKGKKQAQQKLDKKLGIFRKWIHTRQSRNKFPQTPEKRMAAYEEYMNFFAIEYGFKTDRVIDLAEDNVVFVTLRSSQARRQIQKRNQPPSFRNFWNLCKEDQFPIKGVKVRKAPQPQQIKWNNVGFPLQSKRLRRFFMWLVTFALIGISLGVSIGIAFINKDNLDYKVSVGLSVGISIVVTFINTCIQIAIVYLSYYQNQYISSRQQSNIALKIGFAQVVNSIGVPIVVTLISQADGSKIKYKSWLQPGGLVDDVFFIALLNILVPIAAFLDPWEIYLKLLRWWHSKPSNRLKIHGQKQFNSYFGNYNFDIGYQYAYLIKTAIFTSFFVCMQPIIALFAPIGLMLYYLAIKRNLFYHYQRPSFHFATINKAVDIMLLLCLLAFGFGNLMVNNFIKGQLNGLINGTLITNWIIVGIAGGFTLLVPLRVFYCCLKRPTLAKHDYLEKKALLNTDYDRQNPQTKQIAVYQFQEYLKQLDKQKKLPDQAELIKLHVTKDVLQRQNQKNNQKNVLASKLALSRSMKEMEGTKDPVYNTNLEQYKIITGTLGKDGQVIDDSKSVNSGEKLGGKEGDI